jgi:hypothetical protein
LAVGSDAVISHGSAAAIHRLYGVAPAVLRPELTVPCSARHRLAGVIVHRCRTLTRQEVVARFGVLVTTPARTLVDIAGRYRASVLERILDEGLIERRFGVAELQGCLQRLPVNAAGRSVLDRLLGMRSEGPVADSVLEARAFEALRPLSPFKAHFVLPIGTVVYVIDAAWPDKRVGAEIVGRTHRVASRSAFDRERRKLNDLASAGWRIAHLTSAMSAGEMVGAVRRLL